ncbi:MAG: glycosyltransferase family 4 protein [Erysipelotrichaceae bacterium]|nr:glycosyltransferase family 4 protein [Erysipelotrichaceae bacterium]
MIKVCYVLSTSEYNGGANSSLLDLLSCLDREQFEPVVLMRRDGNITERLDQMHIPYYKIPYINAVKTTSFIKDCTKKVYENKAVKEVKQLFQEIKPDIVHNNSLPALGGMDAANQLGIPYICHIRESVENGLNLQFLDKKKHFFIMQNAYVNIAISKFILDEYQKKVPQGKFMELKDGFDTSVYLNKDKTIFNKDEVTISVYGLLDQQKGQMDAIKAFEVLHERGIQNIRLRIIGDHETEYGKEAVTEVEKAHLDNVSFINRIDDRKKLYDARNEDDIILVCSSAEGLGRVTIEAQLSGALVIGADAGATPEIIDDHKTGLLYECRHAESLADQIVWALNNKDICRNIADAGRRYASDEFDIHKYSDKIMSLYKEIYRKESV